MTAKRMALLCVFIGVTVSGYGQNIVLNPGFEAGPIFSKKKFPDWTLGTTGAPGILTGLDIGTVGPYEGSHWVSISPLDYLGVGVMTQTLATTVGQYYTLSFYAASTTSSANGNGSLLALWGGSTAINATYALSQPGYDNYQQLSTTVQATSTSTVLEFTGFWNAGYNGIDNVSVVPVAPEPNTLFACASGVGLLLIRRRYGAKR